MHISDFHFRKGDEEKLVFIKGLQKERLDLVFVTGDIIDDDSGIDYCIEALRDFNPKYGTYVVLGAHDYYRFTFWKSYGALLFGVEAIGHRNNIDSFCEKLEEIGAVVLKNRGVDVKYKDEKGNARLMQIAGVNDVFLGKDDIENATSDFHPHSFKIFLTHCIDHPEDLASRRFDAVFGGHSHGGQVRFPLVGALITRSNLARKYARGVFKINRTLFHINNGLGGGKWTDFRLLCPPEATFLEIRGNSGNAEFK